MKKKLLLLLLALTSFSISNSSLLADSAVSQDLSLPQSGDGFISINDRAGSFEIEAAPVTVCEYAKFLTAVAAKQDLHSLYNVQTKNLISYDQPWFKTPYYSAAPGKADLPMAYITLVDAMRYCNWKENGGSTVEQYIDCTEKGAYDFNHLNEDGFPMPNPDATCQLPTADQLEEALPQLIIPEGDFNEWTLDEAAVADNMIGIDPATGKMISPTQSEEITFALFNDETQQRSFLSRPGASETTSNNGFRLVKKVPQMEEVARAMTDSASADNVNGASYSLADEKTSKKMTTMPKTLAAGAFYISFAKTVGLLAREASLVEVFPMLLLAVVAFEIYNNL